MSAGRTAIVEDEHTAAAACWSVLLQAPAAIVTDIDGTISAIAPTPAEAVVDPGAKAALQLLTRCLPVVAVVSGRAPQDGAAMVGLPDLVYIGNHGLERIVRREPWTHPVAAAARPAIAAALSEVEAAARGAANVPWLLVENKGVTGTIHYRLAPDPTMAVRFLEPLARAAADRHGLRLTFGRMIFELRPALAVDKGTAIRDLVTDFGLRGIVFFCDDVTDVDTYRGMFELREAGAVATLRVGVLGPETPVSVRNESDVKVQGVQTAAATLLALAARLAGQTELVAAAPTGS